MKLRTALVPAAVFGAAMAIALPAAATAGFDAEARTGFVGKGDVQVPFGWNNEKLQANAEQVTFVYTDTTSYELTCEQETKETFETGPEKNRKTHTRTVTVADTYDAEIKVTYDTRTSTKKNPKGSVVGFSITAPSVSTAEAVPAAGSPCQMEDDTLGTIAAEPAPAVTGTAGDTLTASHETSGSSAVVWTDGVSTL